MTSYFEDPWDTSRILGPIAMLIGVGLLVSAATLGVSTLRERPPFDLETVPSPPTYDDIFADSDWLAKPDVPPPGGWETPWGVDVFWVSETGLASPTSWNAAIYDVAAINAAEEHSATRMTALMEEKLPIYAPMYREVLGQIDDNPNDHRQAHLLAYADVERAFRAYLDEANQKRGVILVGIGEGAPFAISLVNDHVLGDPELKSRFGGLFIGSSRMTMPLDDATAFHWNDQKKATQQSENLIALREALVTRHGEFSRWLEQHLAKPAPPLPPMEMIELSPIRRPGDTPDPGEEIVQ